MKESRRIAVVGAGLAGLAAAARLAEAGLKVDVIEEREGVGGLASSFSWRGFALDIGPHKLFPQSATSLDWIQGLLGDDLVVHKKKSGIWLRGDRIDFPPVLSTGWRQLGTVMGGFAGFAAAAVRQKFQPGPAGTYRDYVIRRFGRFLYERVFEPQAIKLWGPPETLSAELGRLRLPYAGLSQMALGSYRRDRGGSQVNAGEFFYPKQGIGELAQKAADRVSAAGGGFFLGQKPRQVRAGKSGVEIELAGRTVAADILVTTIAPDSLVSILEPKPPLELRKTAEKLRFRSLIMCYLALSVGRLMDDHWIVFPEEKFVFNRLYEPKAFGVDGGNLDETVVAAEITLAPEELFEQTDESIISRVADDLCSTGLVGRNQVGDGLVLRIRRAYPLLDLGFERRRQEVLDYFHSLPSVICAGRSGLFLYDNMDHSIDMGLAAAELIINDRAADWPERARSFENLRIID